MRICLFLCAAVLTGAPARHPLTLDDMARFKDAGDPQVSPDGKWVAYTVATTDVAADKRDTDIWMVSFDGSETIRLTWSPESETSPRWSPDGRYLAFLSSRPGAPKVKGAQIWLLDRRGGEARQLTSSKDTISGYEWSPDSKKMVLVAREKEEPEPETPKPGADAPALKPIVLDRYHFKQDIQGYVRGPHSRIQILDIESGKLEPLTGDTQHDESDPAWSPDGTKIAFVSNYDADPDRTHNSDVFVADAKPGSKPRQLTTFKGPDGGRLAWSPDSKLIAFTRGSEPKLTAYNRPRLAVVPAAGGEARVLGDKFDRGVANPRFSSDGRFLNFLASDDRSEYLARIPVAGGEVERLIDGARVVMSYSTAQGHTAVLASNDSIPGAIYALENGKLRALTTHNDALVAELMLGETEDISFRTSDGAEVHGLLTKPVGYEKGKRYPTLLRIHGGPNGQDAHSFNTERQFFAGNGYAVININYRGSSGRGSAYQEAIFADWGHKEVIDLLAGVDHVIALGVADPDLLGIGGWSYGGILTDYTIATDQRFKAAISGAGSANQISMYGVDQYSFQYDNEIGPPWKNQDGWVKISYPFFHADRIHTPTLFMGGEKDFNVPIAGSEQMYQALRTLNVPAQLVVYPGQFHGITRPSYVRDRMQRYLDWYNKYLKPAPALTTK